MQSLKSAIGNPQSIMKRKSHQLINSGKNYISPSSVCLDHTPPNMMDDRRRLSVSIDEQMSLMEDIPQSHEAGSSSSPHIFHQHSSYLPNIMWYQPDAADATTIMRPTSLCSGSGITARSQYLQPDMLDVFRMFGSYLVGSGHLFQDDQDNNKTNNLRRSVFWPDICENGSSSESDGSDSGRFRRCSILASEQVHGESDFDEGVRRHINIEPVSCASGAYMM